MSPGSLLDADHPENGVLIPRRFTFNHYVPLQVSEKSLYDDAEAAVIVSYFRNSDRRCFYILNEMRKTINGNIWQMVKLFSSIWLFATVLLVLAFSGESWELISSAASTLIDADENFGIKERDALLVLVKPLGGLIAVFIAASLIATFQASGYKLQQEHSARELNWFLSRWLDRINDRYRDAKAEAMGATVGEEKDTKKVAAAARNWHKIMIWMAFRSFFIESFYRNIRFQIDRNRSYYDMGPAFVLFFGTIGLAITYSMAPFLLPGDFAMGIVFLALLAFVSVFYWLRYHRKVVPIELEENWIGFDNLELGKVMDEVVGAYGEEVGYWKNRTGRAE